jgi:hypothetical protein
VEEILGRAGLVDAGRTTHRRIAVPVRLGEVAVTHTGEDVR